MNGRAVVTGGGTGLGKAIAAELTAGGFDVVITGRRKDVLEDTAAELGVRAVPFDITDPDAVLAALDDLPGPIGVLVNNAGGPISDDTGDLDAIRRCWFAELETNLVGHVLVTEALKTRIADDGRIVHIGSLAAKLGGNAYGAAKAGLECYSTQLAFELGPRGITSNVVSPGMLAGEHEWTTVRLARWWSQRAANDRIGRAGEVAALVAFLASPAAGHLTGQVINVSGGVGGR